MKIQTYEKRSVTKHLDTALDNVWQKEEWSVLPGSGEDTWKGLLGGLELFFYYESTFFPHHLLSQSSQGATETEYFSSF